MGQALSQRTSQKEWDCCLVVFLGLSRMLFFCTSLLQLLKRGCLPKTDYDWPYPCNRGEGLNVCVGGSDL